MTLRKERRPARAAGLASLATVACAAALIVAAGCQKSSDGGDDAEAPNRPIPAGTAAPGGSPGPGPNPTVGPGNPTPGPTGVPTNGPTPVPTVVPVDLSTPTPAPTPGGRPDTPAVAADLRERYLAACDAARAKVSSAGSDAAAEAQFTAEEQAANAMYLTTRMGSCKTALGQLETRDWVDLSDRKITFDGFFPLLARARTLVLGGNGLTSVEGLKTLEGLRDLSLSRNPIASAAPLGELQWLENLALSETKLAPGGLTALVKLGGLRRLSLRGTTLSASDLRVVGSLSRLRDLDLSAVKVVPGGGGDPADSDPYALLANLGDLERLEIAKAGVKNLDFASRWTKVKELVAPGNAIAALPAQARWNALETLVLANNPLASVGAADDLPRAPNISTLVLKGTRVRDIAVLKKYGDSLSYLNYEGTPAESQKCPFEYGDACEN